MSMNFLTFADMLKLPADVRNRLTRYVPEIVEASIDLMDVRTNLESAEAFQAKWGASYSEVNDRITMVKLLLGGAKATASEAKSVWDWVAWILERRHRNRLEEEKAAAAAAAAADAARNRDRDET